MRWIGVSAIFLFFVSSEAKSDERYDEKLTLEQKGTRELQAVFRFSAERNYSKNDPADYVVFPRIIQELIDKHSVAKLVITMGQGRWRDEKWGKPPQPATPAGAQVLVEMNAESEEEVDYKLVLLLEALNGILCTSVSQTSLFTSPKFSLTSFDQNTKSYTKFGIISGETTCTENLTRLRKLLACKDNGLSVLLHPSRLYNVLFHSSHIQMEKKCENNRCTSKVEVGIAVVSDISNKKKSKIFLSDIFERKLTSKCSAARTSRIEMTDGKNVDVGTLETPDLEIPIVETNLRKRFVRSWTSQGGFDQKHGTLRISIENNENSRVKAVISQIIPYFIRVRFANIQINCEMDGMYLTKSKTEKSSTLLQYRLEIDQNSTCIVTIPFEKELLRLGDYPPDANHGMHIPAANILVESSGNGKKYSIMSNSLLVALPVPDFSMPFNVICFVATTFSLLFGAIQLYSTMWLAPEIKTSKNLKKIGRVILLAMLAFCTYAHFTELNLNDVRRTISTSFEKLNDLR